MEPVFEGVAQGPPSWFRHPIRRFKSRLRMIQWGAHTRQNGFGEAYTDYRNFIRLWPNPGFTVGPFHWCRASGFGKHYDRR